MEFEKTSTILGGKKWRGRGRRDVDGGRTCDPPDSTLMLHREAVQCQACTPPQVHLKICGFRGDRIELCKGGLSLHDY